jgi:hypothetical protein
MLAAVAVFCASAAYELDKLIGGPGGLPAVFALAAFYLLPAAVSLWSVADARERMWTTVYDFGSLMFFLWPVLLPVYLFRTRGLLGLRIFALFLCAQIAGIVFAMLMAYPLSIQP